MTMRVNWALAEKNQSVSIERHQPVTLRIGARDPLNAIYAGVVELADARDSKSRVRKDVRVRPPPPAPIFLFDF